MIKTVVIGVGYLGYHHSRILKSLPDVELVGVVDIRIDRAKKVGEEFSVDYSDDYKVFIEKADGFIVSTPTVTHFEIAKELLKLNKHILVEKPITDSYEKAEELLSYWDKKTVFTVGHVERFNPALSKLKEQLTYPYYFISERLGRFSKRALDIDVVKDLMIHDLDILFTLAGKDVSDIIAVGVPVITEDIDIANVIIKFKGGCIANVTASRVSAEKVRKVRVFQEGSYFSIDYTLQEISRTDVFKKDIRRTVLSVKKEEPLKLELMNFINSIKGFEEPEVKPEDGVFALKQAEEISKQINGKSKKLFAAKNK